MDPNDDDINEEQIDRDHLIRSAAAITAAAVAVAIALDDIPRQPYRGEPLRGQLETERIIGVSDYTCRGQIRMNRSAFFNLCELVRERGLLGDSVHVSMEEKLCIFLNTIGHNAKNHQFKPSFNYSLSFPLTSLPLSRSSPAPLLSSLASSSTKQAPKPNPIPKNPYAYRSSFEYTMALIIPLPVGTPPQTQQMVLDTGSQLSWVQCNNKSTVRKLREPLPSLFDPSRSSTFSVLPCNNPTCKPRIPDFTLPTSCNQHRLCHYSYFYADGTLAEGNLVQEKVTFSSSQSTPPLILGCAQDSDASTEGILGMNLGRLSFASQAKVSKFSYCVPVRPNRGVTPPVGSFYLGENPSSGGFRYIDLLTFDRSQSQRMPNFDQFAYTVGVEGIRIGAKKLDIPRSAFRPDAGGAGQTMIDSGTEFTFLVEGAYTKVKEEIMKLVGSRVKKGFVYGQALELCFDGDAAEIGQLVGDVVLELEKGVEIVVEKDRVLADVGHGIHCLSIGRSDLLGVESNIIGNFHQQNLWVEFDLANRRVGFGRAECRRSS